MKLREYIRQIKKLYRRYGDMKIVYFIDDEGNDVRLVNYFPSVGILDDDMDFEKGANKPNAICIN